MLLWLVSVSILIIMGKKKGQIVFKLLSSVGSGFFYVGEKNARSAARRMSIMKYDPVVNRYVLFNESKLKSGRKH